jgi:hypothetical protein
MEITLRDEIGNALDVFTVSVVAADTLDVPLVLSDYATPQERAKAPKPTADKPLAPGADGGFEVAAGATNLFLDPVGRDPDKHLLFALSEAVSVTSSDAGLAANQQIVHLVPSEGTRIRIDPAQAGEVTLHVQTNDNSSSASIDLKLRVR